MVGRVLICILTHLYGVSVASSFEHSAQQCRSCAGCSQTCCVQPKDLTGSLALQVGRAGHSKVASVSRASRCKSSTVGAVRIQLGTSVQKAAPFVSDDDDTMQVGEAKNTSDKSAMQAFQPRTKLSKVVMLAEEEDDYERAGEAKSASDKSAMLALQLRTKLSKVVMPAEEEDENDEQAGEAKNTSDKSAMLALQLRTKLSKVVMSTEEDDYEEHGAVGAVGNHASRLGLQLTTKISKVVLNEESDHEASSHKSANHTTGSSGELMLLGLQRMTELNKMVLLTEDDE